MAQKKYEDYVDALCKEFPDIDKGSIENVIEYGLKKIYSYASKCQDIFLKMDRSSDPFFLYIGYNDSPKDKNKQWIRSKREEHTKLRRLFKEKKKTFDGFSYFGLTDEEFKEFEESGTLEKITMYKLIEETDIRYKVNHIFKTKLDSKDYLHWSIIKYNYERDKCEYLENINKNEKNNS